MKTTVKGEPTTQDVVDAINRLTTKLREAYGGDYAFTIIAKGETLAASNNRDGVILPQNGG